MPRPAAPLRASLVVDEDDAPVLLDGIGYVLVPEGAECPTLVPPFRLRRVVLDGVRASSRPSRPSRRAPAVPLASASARRDGVPLAVPLSAQRAYLEGVEAKRARLTPEANPYSGGRGIGAGRRRAWDLGWESA